MDADVQTSDMAPAEIDRIEGGVPERTVCRMTQHLRLLIGPQGLSVAGRQDSVDGAGLITRDIQSALFVECQPVGNDADPSDVFFLTG